MNVPRSCVTPATCRPALNRHHGFMKTVCSFENVRKPGIPNHHLSRSDSGTSLIV